MAATFATPGDFKALSLDKCSTLIIPLPNWLKYPKLDARTILLSVYEF
jgi:hypothetical protein